MKVCTNCQSEITGYGKKFCSLSCSSSYNFRGKTRVDRERVCAWCNTKFLYQKDAAQKFCSRSCAAKFNNRARGHMISCRHCGNLCGTGKSFCDGKCRAAFRRTAEKNKIADWLDGNLDACMTYSLASWAREYVLQQAGYRCEAIDDRTGERCIENRVNPRTGKTVLQVDHIDGNWRNCNIENLRAICPTCHALTPTWGAGNMGNGRTWKKEYKQYKRKTPA